MLQSRFSSKGIAFVFFFVFLSVRTGFKSIAYPSVVKAHDVLDHVHQNDCVTLRFYVDWA